MAIDSVALSIQSAELSAAELAAFADKKPDRSTEYGSPVSLRRPDGPTRNVSSAVFSVAGDGETLSSYMAELGPLLTNLRSVSALEAQVVIDLVVAVTSRSLGYMVDLGPGDLATLAASRCGLVIDTYSSEPDNEQED